MPVLVVLGAVLMGSGILLIFVPRRSGSTKAWSEFSAASLGRIGRLLDHITRMDGDLACLERAMDAVIPEHTEEKINTARCDDVAAAYAEACHRLVELTRVNLRTVPSAVLMRFTELSSAVGQRTHALDHEPPGCATCSSLLRHLDAIGIAIRTDRRRLRLASEPADVLLRELACALRIALTTHLDTVAVALAKRRSGHRPRTAQARPCGTRGLSRPRADAAEGPRLAGSRRPARGATGARGVGSSHRRGCPARQARRGVQCRRSGPARLRRGPRRLLRRADRALRGGRRPTSARSAHHRGHRSRGGPPPRSRNAAVRDARCAPGPE